MEVTVIMKSNMGFSFDSNGNVILSKQLADNMINESNNTDTELFRGKSEFCCTTYTGPGVIIKQHQYKEYPILAELVCIRHAKNDNAAEGSMSKGECTTQ